MADVFISYKSDDRGTVEDIVRGLEREGINLWWDQGIAPTADWRADIARELHAAKVVIVVWSRNSADLDGGKWVIQEAEEADARGGLVPVIIDDVLPPLGMRHVQAADLVDWRGDMQDPRWRGFVETVRAKLEGRAIDTQIARDTGPKTAKASLQGRVAQLSLAIGLAALVVTSAIAFGPIAAAALVGGLFLSYVVLNLLFSRRRNDRAAATFLRRAFAVGWVTTLSNVVVWFAAIGAGAYPYARGVFYQDFSIAVFDEMRTPIPDAQITVSMGGAPTRVAINADGVGQMEYPLFWGPREAIVSLRHRDYETERTIARDGVRFADLTVGAPSGTERLRVRHITVRGFAIDAILQGIRPNGFQHVVPALAGVVRNEVWNEADQYLRQFPTEWMSGQEGHSYFARISDEAQPAASGDAGEESTELNGLESLRYAGPAQITLGADFSGGIYGCAINQALDDNYQLILGDSHSWFTDSVLQPQPSATRTLSVSHLGSVREEDGSVRGSLMRLVDHAFLESLLASNPRVQGNDLRWVGLLRFFTAHKPSPGLLFASFNLTSKNLSDCTEIEASIGIEMPTVSLRVSFIENVSDQPLPVTAILQGMARRDSIEVWTPGGADEAVATPWAGGLLAPGEAIAVPRRLIAEYGLSPQDVAAWRAQAEGPPVSFSVLPDPATAPRISGPNDPLLTRNAQGFMLRSGQVRFLDQSTLLQMIRPRTERRFLDPSSTPRLPLATPYVIGASAESLAVRINDVDFDLREDSGMVLALAGGMEVGSCPFVYATRPGGDTMLNRGTIITDQIGASAEGPSRRYLGRAVGRIEIREREYEISHLNRVRLVVIGGDGEERSYAPEANEVRDDDRAYARLERGDVLPLGFPGYQPRSDDRAVYLEATGYYTPLPAPMEDHLAVRRSSVFQ